MHISNRFLFDLSHRRNVTASHDSPLDTKGNGKEEAPTPRNLERLNWKIISSIHEYIDKRAFDICRQISTYLTLKTVEIHLLKLTFSHCAVPRLPLRKPLVKPGRNLGHLSFWLESCLTCEFITFLEVMENLVILREGANTAPHVIAIRFTPTLRSTFSYYQVYSCNILIYTSSV